MDGEDGNPISADSPIALLAREDLDRLSVDELDARVAALETEIARTKARRAAATSFRSAADRLFGAG
jgi:uncharacterized small protein (DUF1192 family)